MEFCTPQRFPQIAAVLERYGLNLKSIPSQAAIPGSFWGDSEAGIVGTDVYVRNDTPVHSALHEACHTICMDTLRRTSVHTDAGGDFAEENGVCYLQIVLADYLPDFTKATMFHDMDEWGYSFRLGSAQAWFERDAEDARIWLIQHDLMTEDNRPTWHTRT